MRETIARVLRSYGLSLGGTAGGRRLAADAADTPIVIDTDHHPLRWERGEWQGLEALGILGVVMRRIAEGSVSLSPEPAEAPLCRAVIDQPANHDTGMLRGLHEQGVRGVRFRLGDGGDAAAMLCYADGLVLPGWHIELELPPGDSQALHRAEWILTRMPVPVCFTGLAQFLRHGTAATSEIALVLEFVHMGRFWLKLSGAELVSAPQPARDAVSALAHQAMAMRPDRLLWGSGAAPSGDLRRHLAEALQALRQWFPDQAQQQRILTLNPAALYGF